MGSAEKDDGYTGSAFADNNSFDVVVVGGGVVGLAVLRAVTLAGYKAALVEKEPDLLTWASGSNSGTCCRL